MSPIIVLMPIAVVLLAVGGVVIALLINSKTRWWTLGMLGLTMMLTLLLVVGVFFLRVSRVSMPAPPIASQAYPQQIRQQTQHDPAADCIVGDYESVYEDFVQPQAKATKKSNKSKLKAVKKRSEQKKKRTAAAENDETTNSTERDENLTDAQLGGIIKKVAQAVASELPKEEDRRNAMRAIWTIIEQAAEYQKQHDLAKSATGVSPVHSNRQPGQDARDRRPSKTVGRLVSSAPTPKRPDWVDAPPGKVGDVYQMTATVGPYSSRRECDHALPNELRRAVAEYVQRYLGSQAKHRVRLPSDYMSDHVIKATWEEDQVSSVGPMKQRYVLLQFDRKTNGLLKQRWHDVQTEKRIWQAAIALACVLLVLAVAYGVLKLSAAGGIGLRPLVIWGLVLGIPVVLLGLFFMVASFVYISCDEAVKESHDMAMEELAPARMEASSRLAPNVVLDDSQLKSKDIAMPYEIAVDETAADESTETLTMKYQSDLSLFPLFLLFPLACGVVALVAFKKTRVFGLILITVLAVGLPAMLLLWNVSVDAPM